jgi:hypothetical protein
MKPSKIFLLYGRTQAGKTTVAKFLSNNMNLKVGEFDVGESTTNNITPIIFSNPNFCNGETVLFLDSIGYDDSSINFSDKFIQDRIASELLHNTNSSHLDGIILVDSAKHDTDSIVNSVKRLVLIFGSDIVNSISVLVTKTNAVSDKQKFTRMQTVKTKAADKKIKGDVMEFVTPYLNLDLEQIKQWDQQVFNLSKGLSKVDKFNIDYLANLKQVLMDRAGEIRNEKKTTNPIDYFVQEDVVFDGHLSHGRQFNLPNAVQSINTRCTDSKVIFTVINKYQRLEYIYPPLELCHEEALREHDEKVRKAMSSNT